MIDRSVFSRPACTGVPKPVKEGKESLISGKNVMLECLILLILGDEVKI
jgi:hypothetical protein